MPVHSPLQSLALAAPTPSPSPSQYRVVDSSTSEGPIRGPSRRNPVPPVVTSSAQPTPTPRDPFTIYDAVLDLPDAPPLPGRPARILPRLAADADSEDLMNNFVPMLQEYLTRACFSRRFSRAARLSSSRVAVQQSAPSLPAPESIELEAPDVEEEEVYDVYYRDLREVAGASDVATLAGLQRIGALCVLSLLFAPLRFALTNLVLACRAGIVDDDLLSLELSSEDEDEADQDSNGSLCSARGSLRPLSHVLQRPQRRTTTATTTPRATRNLIATRSVAGMVAARTTSSSLSLWCHRYSSCSHFRTGNSTAH